MKLILALFAFLAITGLGQAHQVPDFGEGPLHEDLQDILDLAPLEEISKIISRYMEEDAEVQAAMELLDSLMRPMMVDFEAISEVYTLLNYLQKEGIHAYEIMNEINKRLDIEELVPPPSRGYSKIAETGGLVGLCDEILAALDYSSFIHIYAEKLKNSKDFVSFIEELKSNNFQELVNKTYKIQAVQLILLGLRSAGVHIYIVSDMMFILLGITIPETQNYPYAKRTVMEELMDFFELLPIEKYMEIVLDYIYGDKQVQEAIQFLFTIEFHDKLRSVEALKEYQAIVVYIEKAGFPVTDFIKSFHEAIGMEDYVSPKIEKIIKSQFGVQKVGGGMKGMIKDLYDALPLNQIDALYEKKLKKSSKVFADFITTLTSSQMQKLINDLYSNRTYRDFVMEMRQKGLELQDLTKYISRIFGLKFPY